MPSVAYIFSKIALKIEEMNSVFGGCFLSALKE